MEKQITKKNIARQNRNFRLSEYNLGDNKDYVYEVGGEGECGGTSESVHCLYYICDEAKTEV